MERVWEGYAVESSMAAFSVRIVPIGNPPCTLLTVHRLRAFVFYPTANSASFVLIDCGTSATTSQYSFS